MQSRRARHVDPLSARRKLIRVTQTTDAFDQNKTASGRSISRILSMTHSRHWAIISLGSLPETVSGTGSSIVSARPCFRRGLPSTITLLQSPVVSYTTFSPSPHVNAGCLFLWPCSDRLLHPGVSPAPRPVKCGLSSITLARHRNRPTDLRQLHHTRKRWERQLGASSTNLLKSWHKSVYFGKTSIGVFQFRR